VLNNKFVELEFTAPSETQFEFLDAWDIKGCKHGFENPVPLHEYLWVSS
jgi:hypothetical protein